MKKLLIFILIICICFNTILLSSCKKSAENEDVKETETEEVKLDSNTEIVEFELFGKLKKGMSYEEVTKILNNPGKKAQLVGNYYAYRLKDNYIAFVEFGVESKMERLKIEPLLSAEKYEYIKKQVKQNGYAPVNSALLDTLGTLGNHIGSGFDYHDFYLSDGRIAVLCFGYVDNYDGLVVMSVDETAQPWFEP